MVSKDYAAINYVMITEQLNEIDNKKFNEQNIIIKITLPFNTPYYYVSTIVLLGLAFAPT